MDYDFTKMSDTAKQTACVILRASLHDIEHLVGTEEYLAVLKEAQAQINLLIAQEAENGI